jgi:hypothetical protein
MKSLKTLLLLLLLIPFISKGQEIKYRISKKEKPQSVILISNGTNESKNVSSLLTDYFFLSDSSLISYIRQLNVPNDLNRDYRKAWYFMVHFTWSARVPLAQRDQINNGLEFFNSLGWGYCGIKSQMLAWIWNKMDYKSRVWDLKGHIIPEVFVDDHWEVWDPTYHVFYPGNKGIPVSIDSLSLRPELIYHPNNPYTLKKNFWMRMTGYSHNLSQMYASTENNRMLENEVVLPIDRTTLVFELPAHSKMLFPVYSGLPLWSDFHGEIKRLYDYAECAFFIEAGYTGKVHIPLVLHAIASSEATIQNAEKRVVFDKKHSSDVCVGYEGENSIEILENSGGVWLFYLVNPQLIKRNIENIPESKSVEGITVSHVIPSAPNRVNVILLSDVQHGIRVDKFRKAFFRWISAKK